MTIDEALKSLARLHRPELPPFWSARVTARTRDARSPRVSRTMWLYWMALAAVAGPALLTSWQRVAAVGVITFALVLIVAVTPGPRHWRY